METLLDNISEIKMTPTGKLCYEFKLELYLLKLSRDVFQCIVRFRCSNHKLAIETG